MNRLLAVDTTMFARLNGLAGRSAALDGVMMAVARFSPELFALVLVGLWLTWRARYQRGAALAGGAALLALGIGQLVGMALPRARPYEVLPMAHLLVPHSPDTSFPSDHTILAFAVAVLIWRVSRPLGTVLLLLALWTAAARVFIGAHYPSDVLGGAVLGAAVSLAVWALSARRPLAPVLDWVFDQLRRLRLAAPPGVPGVAAARNATARPR